MSIPAVKQKEKYIDSLDKLSRLRYVEKISAVGGLDPYEIVDWSDDVKLFPSVAVEDIHDYLVHRTSFYTSKALKAFKALGAHNQHTSGWVKSLFVHKPRGCDNTVITAEVYHSQSLSEKPLQPWVIAEADGTIVAAHCDCMAGIAESCSHVAASLFAVDAAVRLRDSQTPTQVLAGWVVPLTKDVVYAKCADIDFTKAATKKRQLDALIDGTPSQVKTKRKPAAVPETTPEELRTLYDSISFAKTGFKPAILSLVPEYAADYEAATLTKLPKYLKDLEDEDLVKKMHSEVLQHCQDIDISVTLEQILLVEKETRDQAKSKTWQRVRTGRVTASKAHQVMHTNPAQPALGLISSICNASDGPRKETASMRWGNDHEKDARNAYAEAMKSSHTKFKLEQCGFFISQEYPFLGASPDSIRCCECHGRGCVEIKCPSSKKDCTIEESLVDPKFCLEKSDDGSFRLKQKHEYYTQVQVQMFVTGTDFCDCVVWTPKDMVVVTVEANKGFQEDMLPKLEHIFAVAILPELVGRVFSRPRPLPLSPTKRKPQPTPADPKYCYCQRGEEEDNMPWVGCDNENCKLQWFHFFCVGIKTAPKGQWFCPECRQLPQFRRGGKVKPKALNPVN